MKEFLKKSELLGRLVTNNKGQATTEYAILVGVLVVIAIVAVTAFKGRLQELWDTISGGINGSDNSDRKRRWLWYTSAALLALVFVAAMERGFLTSLLLRMLRRIAWWMPVGE